MRWVKYVGLAHERIITAENWASVQEHKMQTVVWNAFNGFAVPLDHFSDEQVKKAIEPDPNFVVTDEDDDFKPTPQKVAMTPGALTQTVEAPVTPVDLVNASTTDQQASGGVAPTGDTAS